VIGKAKPLTTKDTKEHGGRAGRIAVIGKAKFFFTAKDAKGAEEVGKNKNLYHRGHRESP
jgi:hypothetical protein